jgi:hypothetical protein
MAKLASTAPGVILAGKYGLIIGETPLDFRLRTLALVWPVIVTVGGVLVITVTLKILYVISLALPVAL